MRRSLSVTFPVLALTTFLLGVAPALGQETDLERRVALGTETEEARDAEPATQGGLVTLEGFDPFVETFNRYKDVPRIVLVLSPT